MRSLLILLIGIATFAAFANLPAPTQEPAAARAVSPVENWSKLKVVRGSPPLATSTSVGAGRSVLVVVDGLANFLRFEPQTPVQFALFLDGHLVPGTQVSVLPDKTALRFQLPRDDAAGAGWRDLASDIRWHKVTVSAGSAELGEIPSAVDNFSLLSLSGLYVWFAVLAITSALAIVVARRTDLLRDRAASYVGRGPYSLERTQVFFFSFSFCLGYQFLWLLLGEPQPLTTGALGLLAIVFGTLVASTLLQSREVAADALPVYARVLSRGFFADILSDASGISLTHVLVVGWTLVLTSVIGFAVYSTLAIPMISSSLLVVTALVNGLYLVTRSGLAFGRSKAARERGSSIVHEEPDFVLAPPAVPDDLVQALRDGKCVLYAGAGVSANAGLPTWRPFVEGLVKWALSEQLIDAIFAKALEQSIARGGIDRAADGVVSALIERGGADRLHQYLSEIFGTMGDLPAVHQLIGRLPFNAALTTNFDDLIDRTFPGEFPGSTRIPGDIETLRSDFSSNRFFVLKLYGDLKQPSSLMISPAQYIERIRGDQPFLDFVEQVFKSRSLLFLGSSVAGIEAYLAPLGIRNPGRATHYALVAVSDAGWQTDARLLERRYGIRVLPYRASARHGELSAFLNQLGQRLAAEQTAAAGSEQPSSQPTDPAIVLEHLQLHNIGPFERLDLPFTRRWTVLLGDNGVGKSSVLRAIGTVVAGDVAKTEGGRLLRSGQKDGSIVVTSRGEPYETQVALDSLGRPGAIAQGASGLGGSILVLSFPAVRTMATGAERGPELKELNVAPNATDVLPGLDSLPDPRILGFKQWLINLDYAKRRNPALTAQVDAIFAALGRALETLLGGNKIGSFDIDDKNVFVRTEDGRLPLDALSQGTVSLLGWVGVLVQRLHEIPARLEARALVLIDEIDAHMHPEWQQAIVKRLSDAFPNVQFIVSSHSPFLAVGREAGEIVRFRRDPLTKKVRADPTDRDTKGMTVADVLTSYLFGLQTPVDPDLEEGVLRLRRLSVQPTLSESERRELAELQTRLGHVGIAGTQADPMYGRFIEELRRQRQDSLSTMPALSKEAEAEQRELTERMVREVLGRSSDSSSEGSL